MRASRVPGRAVARSRSDGQELHEVSEVRSTGLFGELWGFMAYSKKWWLTPIVLMLLLGALILVGGTGAAPFI
jgi:hypothetical protein